ncbi:LEAF RUST 10 DISEASE-RESISTANCE LOCUS RECEPTOR-LIKE PROTEIN KINASE-like 2.1 [Lycium barbarum]|uniref:LEAF RUST 10 DISEASE-RESISTANCE LOCUS RECEPTOR-LIKE PROTEIN KINASE-like 2.1 n=1 Tax=Lycium barbarum TaxID=112863 RepID=UPI00293E0635|nr:LEAF RUST 10 DISEASE-RESISTANCE LOCUS RECEPTOR-LIKE PROTEIN KINASE-like 2.1 [Lycium barbarum]
MIMLSLYHLTTTFFLLILVTIPSSNSFLFEGESINCEGTYNCGSIHGVKYPFWGGGVRSRLCGRDDYLLECKNNVSSTLPGPYFFRKHTNGYQPSKFRILTINESSTRMRIVHDKLWHNVCPKSPSFFNLYGYNTTLINGLRYVPRTTFINIYYGCNPEVLSHVQLPSNINCSVRGTTSTGVFFADEIVGNYVRGCSFSIVVPLVSTAYQQLWDTTLRLQEAVNEGFEVDYSDASGGCLACQDSGGTCEFDQAFRCRCGDTVLPFTCPTNGKPALMQPNTNFARKIHLLKLATGVSVAGIGMLMCFGIWYTQYRKSFYKCIRLINGKTKDQSLEGLLKQYGSLAPKRYSYWEIKKMTSGFKDKLGEGGYGGVYKGELFDGRVVAVKILKASKGDGEEFINEVASITQTSHVNVVSLLGYCLDGRKRALIYDFMPNGSLEKYIYGDGSLLGLQKLYQIAVGIAKGLEYLHRGCNTRILHFDIKPHNILLDEEFCPKISDFGLAKLCTRKESVISMLGARGTIGYIAPEVISRSFGGVSHKSDVYSYGMMVLEMVGGRKNVNEKVSHASEIYFPYWAYQHVQLDDDLKLRGIINKEEEVTARKMILVGLWCIQTDPAQRPSMSKVIDMLEGSLILEIPPKPLLCTPYCSGRHSLTTQGLPLKASLISPSSSSLCSPEASAIS